jgi:hypothetical protein
MLLRIFPVPGKGGDTDEEDCEKRYNGKKERASQDQ